MPHITSNAGNKPVNIYVEDLGEGRPIVLIHGWPLSSSMWEYQIPALVERGHRVIAYDRRGFGKSDFPADGYDYDTLAGDLKAVLDHLDLNDVTLVGFSMGGGEVARYFARYQGARVARVVLVSAVVPYMLKTDSNPDGVAQEVFDEMAANIRKDRPSFLHDFTRTFYSDSLLRNVISETYLQVAVGKAMESSPIATLHCAKAFASTDFRQDVKKINVPALVIHGDDDKTVPIKATGEESARLIPGATLVVYEGAPHGLWFTDKEKLTDDLDAFARQTAIPAWTAETSAV